jgi:TPR repeat protein
MTRSILLKRKRASTDWNNSIAQYLVGTMYRDGYGVEKDTKIALEWLKLSANDDFVEAQAAMGCIFEDGRDGIEIDLKEAMSWYKNAASKNMLYSNHIQKSGDDDGPTYYHPF